LKLNPLLIGVVVFAIILGGAFAGWVLRRRLPPHHLSNETKSLVSVSMAVVATVSALVLGLLISNANSSFISLGGQVTTLSAQILRLDQMLRRYGPDTNPAREKLKQYAEDKAVDLFPNDAANVQLGNPSTYELLQQIEDFDAYIETRKSPRPMVARPSSDACGEDWRHPLAIGPAGRARNSKSVPGSPGLLADFVVRQFRSVRAA
jgi:hypothetical protein